MPLRVFPVDPSGKPTFNDDFGARRGTRLHGGIDIFAKEGTPVLAVDNGRVRYDENKLGGHTAYLKGNDGTSYYYAHLQRYEGKARPVTAGDVIAYVGHTGNAATTPPHCHFQETPAGASSPIDPFPDLVAVAPRGSLPRTLPGPTPTPAPAPRKPPTGQPGGLGWLFLAFLLYRASRRG